MSCRTCKYWKYPFSKQIGYATCTFAAETPDGKFDGPAVVLLTGPTNNDLVKGELVTHQDFSCSHWSYVQ